MFNYAKGYITITERRFNSINYTTLFCCLGIVALLNFISPCDGKNGGMISAILTRFTGGPTDAIRPNITDFHMNISSFSFAPSGMALLNITLSSAGKVTCVVGDSHLSVNDVSFEETSYNRYFFRSGVPSMEAFGLNHVPGIEQRVFCEAVCLLTPQHFTAHFVSEPFYSSRLPSMCTSCVDMSWGIVPRHSTRRTLSFSVLYDRILISDKPVGEPSANVTIHCTASLLPDSKRLHCRQGKKAEMEAVGSLPMELMMRNPNPYHKQQLVCTMKKWDARKKEWIEEDDNVKSAQMESTSIVRFYEDWLV